MKWKNDLKKRKKKNLINKFSLEILSMLEILFVNYFYNDSILVWKTITDDWMNIFKIPTKEFTIFFFHYIFLNIKKRPLPYKGI